MGRLGYECDVVLRNIDRKIKKKSKKIIKNLGS